MFSSLIFACWILITFSRNVVRAQQIEATAYPVATTVLVGDSVQFECNVLEPPGSNQILEWYIEWDIDTELKRMISATDVGYVSADEKSEFVGRGLYETQYSVSTGPDGYKNHQCALFIHPTTLLDNGDFGCTHQKPGESWHTLLHRRARLTIVPEPTVNPECNLNKRKNVFVLTCISLQGIPLAHLIWYDEAGQNKSAAVQTFNSIEVIEANDMVERTFVCNARQGDDKIGSCSITLIGSDGTIDNDLGAPIIPTTKPITPDTKPIIPSTQPTTSTSAIILKATTDVFPTYRVTETNSQNIGGTIDNDLGAPIIPTTKPITPDTKPIIPSTQPTTSTSAIILKTATDVFPTYRVTETNSQNIGGTIDNDLGAPIIPTTKPITPDTKPIIPSTQPTTSNSAIILKTATDVFPTDRVTEKNSQNIGDDTTAIVGGVLSVVILILILLLLLLWLKQRQKNATENPRAAAPNTNAPHIYETRIESNMSNVELTHRTAAPSHVYETSIEKEPETANQTDESPYYTIA